MSANEALVKFASTVSRWPSWCDTLLTGVFQFLASCSGESSRLALSARAIIDGLEAVCGLAIATLRGAARGRSHRGVSGQTVGKLWD
jgi:hypothetical protein